ncbi:endolytic transglycosylase MltG [Dongia sp.]|uniref:endolytic transglycosylase MltG n=1 Tax=Dongia sp. TaxID=1977262 RepID=UPI0035B0E152
MPLSRSLAKLAGGLLLLALLAIGGSSIWFWNAFNGNGPLAEEKTVVVPKGSGVATIAALLAEEGVIRSPLVFKIGVQLFGKEQPLQAGEFRFPAAASPRGAMQVLIEGKSVLHRITIAEGLTVREIFGVLQGTPLLEGPLPPLPPEGSLLPETYFFVRGDARGAIVERMQINMRAQLADLWEKRDTKLTTLESPEEAVILASIVEKETGVKAERARVAAVFHNRLKIGMPLQSDPTAIYGITLGRQDLGRNLTYADLKAVNDYNTYVIPGLPPAPIANPGIEALHAVLNPITSKELYFVADGTGGHAFAETLDQHNKNVAKWRKLQKQSQGQ